MSTPYPIETERRFKIQWTEHVSNGGTGIQTMTTPELKESARLYGDAAIWLQGEQLHTSLRDLSAFWQFHRERTGGQ